jgi:hypothetical protein
MNAKDVERPAGHGRESINHADGRCLAGPVGPQDAKAFSGQDMKGNTVHGHKIAEGFSQILCFNNGIHIQTFPYFLCFMTYP